MHRTQPAQMSSLAHVSRPLQQWDSAHASHVGDHLLPTSATPQAALAPAESVATPASFEDVSDTVDESKIAESGSATRLHAVSSSTPKPAMRSNQLLANFSAGYFFAAASRCSVTIADVMTSDNKSREPSG